MTLDLRPEDLPSGPILSLAQKVTELPGTQVPVAKREYVSSPIGLLPTPDEIRGHSTQMEDIVRAILLLFSPILPAFGLFRNDLVVFWVLLP